MPLAELVTDDSFTGRAWGQERGASDRAHMPRGISGADSQRSGLAVSVPDLRQLLEAG
jgi:hypothetical protein